MIKKNKMLCWNWKVVMKTLSTKLWKNCIEKVKIKGFGDKFIYGIMHNYIEKGTVMSLVR